MSSVTKKKEQSAEDAAPFWRDRERLKAEVAKHVTLDATSVAHGVSSRTLQIWWQRHGLPKFPPGPRIGPQSSRVTTTDTEWLLQAIKRLGDEASLEELANEADVSPRRIQEELERLGGMGFRISENTSTVTLDRSTATKAEHYKARPELFKGDLFRFAIVSDVHLGSKAERVDALITAYEVIAREGIQTVYNAGDLVDGLDIYKGQNNEIKFHTYESQVDHAVEVYPMQDGITTYFIGGNHDLEGEFGRAGADPVQAFSNQRSDVEYLGRYSAWIELPNGASMHLLHPQGGTSYAISYRAQKHVESYESGQKPSILILGHWHRCGWFPIRNVQTILAGTFQGPTPYSIRMAMGQPGWGFYIVDCYLADDGSIVRFKPEFFPFYLGR